MKIIRFGLIYVTIIFIMAGSSFADDCKAKYGNKGLTFRLATGSPGELGLLKEVARVFNVRNNSSMCWIKAGVQPIGDWYIITKDFMMATLIKADQVKGYFMTDSSTWVAGKKDISNLKVLFRGDPFLINTYHSLCQPKNGSRIQAVASKFIDFLSSEEGQRIIRDYGKNLYGAPMYNDAEYAKQYDH